jgi:phosphate transport system permease protein
MTGVILAIGRALGEAAPLVAVGAAGYASAAPRGLFDVFSAMPLRIFFWAGEPSSEAHELAAAAIIVLLVLLVIMNIGAVWVRYRSGKHIKW